MSGKGREFETSDDLYGVGGVVDYGVETCPVVERYESKYRVVEVAEGGGNGAGGENEKSPDPVLVALETQRSASDPPHVRTLREKLRREILSGGRSRAVLRLYARLLRTLGRSP